MATTSLEGSYDGLAPFIYPAANKPLQTYYRVFGDLKSNITPLVCIHGGPGFPHNYLLNHSTLTKSVAAHSIPIPTIFYDQIGSGLSTRLPETSATPHFWTESIFISQLTQLLTHLGISSHYDILGSSWGGMLGSAFASTNPPGLRKLILANAAASKELSCLNRRKLRLFLSSEMQEILDRNEAAGTWDTEEVNAVMEEFTKRFVCNVVPVPEDILASVRLNREDRTVNDAMGEDGEHHNPFESTGYLKTWTMIGRAKNITVPTLIINGINEYASGDAVKPFLDNISDVRLVTLEGTTHSPHLERKDKYFSVVRAFLEE